MINVEINGNAPEHVDRLTPQINVDDTGRISWIPGFIDYNAGLYPRGKQITSEEFNEALLKSVFQGNYLTDSINDLLNNHLNTAISRTFKSTFNLVPSYIKVFGTEDWGAQQDDGYYYITITPEEHGFIVNTEEAPTERMNIDTEMCLLDSEGNFYEVSQVTVDTLNNVVLYTDDNALIGFVVVRTNDKSYALADTLIDATQVVGLSKVATSAKYTDLIDRTNIEGTGPDDRINRNTKNINAIISGQYDSGTELKVAKAVHTDMADYAENLIGTIRNIPLDNIFVAGSSEVYQALEAEHANHADSADHANSANITGLDLDNPSTVSFKIGGGTEYTKTITRVQEAQQAEQANLAAKDHLGRVIASTYATGLCITRKNIAIELRVGNSNTGSDSVNLFDESEGTTVNAPALVAQGLDGSNPLIINCNYVHKISVNNNRYDKKYLFVNIKDFPVENYPQTIMLISDNFNYGATPNYATTGKIPDAMYIAQIQGKAFLRYDFYEDGYDFNNGAYVIVQML